MLDQGERDALGAATIRYQPHKSNAATWRSFISYFPSGADRQWRCIQRHSGCHHFCVEIIQIVISWELQLTERRVASPTSSSFLFWHSVAESKEPEMTSSAMADYGAFHGLRLLLLREPHAETFRMAMTTASPDDALSWRYRLRRMPPGIGLQ